MSTLGGMRSLLTIIGMREPREDMSSVGLFELVVVQGLDIMPGYASVNTTLGVF